MIRERTVVRVGGSFILIGHDVKEREWKQGKCKMDLSEGFDGHPRLVEKVEYSV